MKITYKDTTLTVETWAKVMEINPNTLRARINRGMNPVDALMLKPLTRRQCAKRSAWKIRQFKVRKR